MQKVIDFDEHQKRENLLIERLTALSEFQLSSESQIGAEVEFFCKLYSDGFRHDYADVAKFVRRFSFPDKERSARKFMYHDSEMVASFDRKRENSSCLSENLTNIERFSLDKYRVSHDDRYSEVAIRIHKLNDHIGLEEYRLSDVREMREIGQRHAHMSAQLGFAEKQVESISNTLQQELDKSGRIVNETISILGIFAAVVLAFNAGISFVTSSIEPVSTSGVLAIALLVAIVGLVIFNSMFALFTFIYRMVRQNGMLWCILSKGTFSAVNAFILSAILLLCFASCNNPYVPESQNAESSAQAQEQVSGPEDNQPSSPADDQVDDETGEPSGDLTPKSESLQPVTE